MSQPTVVKRRLLVVSKKGPKVPQIRVGGQFHPATPLQHRADQAGRRTGGQFPPPSTHRADWRAGGPWPHPPPGGGADSPPRSDGRGRGPPGRVVVRGGSAGGGEGLGGGPPVRPGEGPGWGALFACGITQSHYRAENWVAQPLSQWCNTLYDNDFCRSAKRGTLSANGRVGPPQSRQNETPAQP
jgi:hypothetical protein